MAYNSLYHYCCMDTFIKILGNKTIRVSDCSKTNDYSETQWVVREFTNVIIQSILDDKEFCNIYDYDNALKEYITLNLTNVINNVYVNNSRYMFTYVTCFSELGDILSQWRSYANDGKGLSIGFNKDILMSFDTGGYNYHFKKIIYDDELQVNYYKDEILPLVHAYKQIDRTDNIEKRLKEFIMDICLRIATLRNNTPFFKNSAFSEEKEWRLIINNHLTNYNNIDSFNNDNTVGTIDENFTADAKFNNGFVRLPIQFRASQDNIVPYFDMSFEKIKNNLINDIYIGPKCRITELDLRFFLESNGYNYEKIKIFNSRATYR